MNNVIIYNRIGKCGSSSILQILKHECLIKEVKIPSAFAPNNTSRKVLKKAVEDLRKTNTKKCRVVIGHFQYIHLEASDVKYMNIICEPLKRWISLHNFYLYSPIPFRRKRISLNNCHTVKNITRGCVAAEDSHISDYFGTCDVFKLRKMYDFLEPLELLQNDLKSLYMFITNNKWSASKKLVLKNNTTNRVYVNNTIKAQIQQELKCDIMLWNWVYSQSVSERKCIYISPWSRNDFRCLTLQDISEKNQQWRIYGEDKPRCWNKVYEGLIIC